MSKWNLYGINFFYDDEFRSKYSEPEEEANLTPPHNPFLIKD